MAHFCTQTGARIAAPGVSKAVDPENGHDEIIEVDGEEVVVKTKRAKPATSDDAGDGGKGDAGESSGKGGGKARASGKGKGGAPEGDGKPTNETAGDGGKGDAQ